MAPLTTALLATDDPRWASFVSGHPDALPFHTPSWSATLADAYGFDGSVLVALEPTGTVVGGLPFMEVRDPLRRRRWVALPFTDRCPPLLAHPGAATVLAENLASAAAEAGVTRVQTRAALPGWTKDAVATMHELDLAPGPEKLLKSFSSAARRNVRKAQREGVVVRPAQTEEELVDVYYALHLRTRHRLGVPIQPRRFFRSLWRTMLEPGHGQLLLAVADGTPIAGAVFLHAGSTVVYKYGASDERAWHLRANNLIFAEAISGAAESGHASMDFGRSDFADAGLRAFKVGLGAVEGPLDYSVPPGAAPIGAPQGGRFLTSVIQRAPAGVCRAIGESLYRYAA